MTLLTGADSAVPQPDLYRGHTIWGVYIAGDTPHVWTHAEVAALAAHGVRGVLPIAVPPQKESWWVEDKGYGTNEGYGTLEGLVRAAAVWGLPHGSPLVLDVEEAQAEKIGSNTCHAWAIACGVHHYIPWIYSSAGLLARDHWCRHWLAKWYGEAGEDHEAPPALLLNDVGWQYAGNVENGRIDRDIFAAGQTYLTPQLKVEVIMSVNAGEAAFGTPVPPDAPAEPAAPVEPTAEEIAAAEDVKVDDEHPPASTAPEPEPEPEADPATTKALADAAAAKLEIAEARDKLHAWVDSFFA